MEILIKTRDVELNQGTETYIRSKLGPIERRLRDDAEAMVEIKRAPTRSARHQVVVQLTLNLNGTLLRAEERGPNVNDAMDVAAKALGRQVARFKGQRVARMRSARSKPTLDSIPEVLDDEEINDSSVETSLSNGKVVRVKRFFMKPATLEEAATQMDLLGHDFYFFINASTQQYNVLYRRRDGDYTVIEPDDM